LLRESDPLLGTVAPPELEHPVSSPFYLHSFRTSISSFASLNLPNQLTYLHIPEPA